ncbi:MAG: AMP-binding protein [Desulfohalobiaceae bacterium]
MHLTTLGDLIEQMPRLGGREAIRDSTGYRTRTYSYSELRDLIAEYCAYFAERGLAKGDRLVLWAESCAEWVAAFWAGAALGVELVPLESRFSGEFMESVARETGAALTLVDGNRDVSGLSVAFLRLTDLPTPKGRAGMPRTRIEPEDVLEIIYTSGTTGRPKGVVHRHKNICADLRPIFREMGRYTPFLRPFQPIRVLNLLPLSHMFGQSLGLFIPVLLGGSSVFSRELAPGRILEVIRRERVTALVAVPRMIRQLGDHLEHRLGLSSPDRVRESARSRPFFRIWRYRRVHSLLGWRFWALVVGGAELRGEVETWWRGLGFIPVQGYGLTEASPIVALNHPFRTRQGSLGKLLEGQEARIAEDGELLLRGDNISREYFGQEGAVRGEDESGWLHTGDIMERDEEGRLYYRGRKKDVIVTAEGVNVHPEDVEPVLSRMSGVRDSAVVEAAGPDGEPRAHAVILSDGDSADPDHVLREANRMLEPHQRLSAVDLWPGEDFPRTPSTQKVLRRKVARWVEQGAEEAPPQESAETETSAIRRALSRLTGLPVQSITEQTDLTRDLGLSSLDLVELSSLLESDYGMDADAALLAGDMRVGRLEAALLEGGTAQAVSVWGKEEAGAGRSTEEPGRYTPRELAYTPPRWARKAPFRWGRAAVQEAVLLPLFWIYTRFRILGREHLREVRAPVILAANHSSHLDTLAVLAALPPSWRRRFAPSMQLEFFHPHFFPAGQPLWRRIWSSFQYAVACGLMNGFPLPVSSGGLKGAFRYAGEMADNGYCPLIFPEGIMTPDGTIHPFRPGVAMLAERLALPVVPVALSGLFESFPYHARLPRPGRITARIGAPLVYEGEEYAEFTRRVEDSVVRLRGNGEI